jgi:tRNA-2-methylthio-N6-dimethylallyladenosine synthase
MLNTEQIVLVEGLSKKTDKEFSGRTENNRIVNFSAPEDVIGKFVRINISEIYSNSLRGTYLETLH